jgi:general secretion pathway protein D
MSNENMPILPEWQDNLTLPPSFEEYQNNIEQKKNGLSESPAVEAVNN